MSKTLLNFDAVSIEWQVKKFHVGTESRSKTVIYHQNPLPQWSEGQSILIRHPVMGNFRFSSEEIRGVKTREQRTDSGFYVTEIVTADPVTA